MPKKVDALEVKDTTQDKALIDTMFAVDIKNIEQDKQIIETQHSVDKLASNIDSYVTEQKVIRAEQEKREQLMLKLIDTVSKN